MTAFSLNREFAASRDRTRRTLGVSLVLHALFFLWLLLHQQVTLPPEGIVEITWLDPAPPQMQPAPAPPKTVETKAVSQPVAPPSSELKFQRKQQKADVAPKPQDLRASRDRLKERLASLRQSSAVERTLSAAPVASSSLLKSAPATINAPSTGTKPVHLTRQKSPNAAPLNLKRGTVRSPNPRPTMATIPREMPVAAAPVPEVESAARRTLEGASLAGPVADRPVISYFMPTYPEWAKSEAVEASVTLYFVVLPDGRVKENVQVQKTAGFVDFDQNALDALLKWRFEPLAGSAAEEQWGTITFRYRLRDVQ